MQKIMDSFLFDSTEVEKIIEKKPRIYSYDIMRGIAVVLMILIHVVHVYAKPYIENTVIGYVIEFLGGPPAAPTFMMLMGIFFIYSNKGTTRESIARGFNILLISVALNLVRGIIPYYFLTEVKGVSLESLGIYMKMEFLIFEVDILTFAGLSYMFMAVLYHYFKKPVVWISLAAVIAIGSPLLWGIETSSPTLKYALNVLWGDEYLTVFPMFPWLTFPLIGMTIGRLLLTNDQNKSINRMGLWSIFLMAAGIILILINIDYFYNAYGKMGLGAIIAIVGFVFFWQWLITKIYNLVGNRVKTGFFLFLSKNVMSVYFIHWVLCKWGTYFIDRSSLDLAGIFLMFGIITVLTMILTWGYVKLNDKRGA